jgi:integrase
MIVDIPRGHQSFNKYDFSPYYGKNCDVIVYAMQKMIEHMLEESLQSNLLSTTTISGYCRQGAFNFLPFCALMSSALGRDMQLDDINCNLVCRYIAYLAENDVAKITQKQQYNATKSVLVRMVMSGWLGVSRQDLFPKNPYPNSNRSAKGEKPLSWSEMGKLTKALANDLRQIKLCEGILSSYDVSICMLAIAIRTGINLTPLMELTVDCLQTHPLKHDRKLLISFKRRGNSTHVTSLRKSEDVSLISTVMLDVSAIIDMVKERSHVLKKPTNTGFRLFVYSDPRISKTNQMRVMSTSRLAYNIKVFVKKYNLLDDNGVQLRLNVSRLRKSFINRIWRLSGHDPIVTAALGNHSLTVSNNHYLEAPPEAETNFRLMGEIRVKELLSDDDILPPQNTPVAKCKDSLYGHRAPKNGVHCTEFLACFRCKSFVVTKDDLYRIFSLYWLLVKERNSIGGRRWGRLYAHIVRIIDNNIAPQFDSIEVSRIRKKANITPHTYWKTIDSLQESDQ